MNIVVKQLYIHNNMYKLFALFYGIKHRFFLKISKESECACMIKQPFSMIKAFLNKEEVIKTTKI
jgi:hypothetical protein